MAVILTGTTLKRKAMAEKLIDAGAVFNKIAGFSTTLHPNTLSAARVGEVLESMTAFLNSQTDASEPLRKRIAELEVAVRDLIETIDYNRTPNEFFDTRLPEIEALLKGAQDV